VSIVSQSTEKECTILSCSLIQMVRHSETGFSRWRLRYIQSKSQKNNHRGNKTLCTP